MKRNKLYYIRLCVAAIVLGLSVSAFLGFYPVKIFDMQFTAVLQNAWLRHFAEAGVILALLLLLTLLFGRIYCSTLCPLGILQEALMMIFRRWKFLFCRLKLP